MNDKETLAKARAAVTDIMTKHRSKAAQDGGKLHCIVCLDNPAVSEWNMCQVCHAMTGTYCPETERLRGEAEAMINHIANDHIVSVTTDDNHMLCETRTCATTGNQLSAPVAVGAVFGDKTVKTTWIDENGEFRFLLE